MMPNYDDIYRLSGSYRLPYAQSPYYSLWLKALPFISTNDRILDIGAGSGQVGALLKDHGFFHYQGIDISKVAVSQAQALGINVIHADALEWDDWDYDLITAFETFEHIDDLKLIAKFPTGIKVLFSLPNFICKGHLRKYISSLAIKIYYNGYLDIQFAKVAMQKERPKRAPKQWYLINSIKV